MSDILGERLLLAIITDNDLATPRKMGIDKGCIFDESSKGLDFIENFQRSHGTFPTKKQVEDEIGRDLPDVPEPTAYVADMVRKRTLAKKLRDTYFKPAIEQLDDRDPDAALETILRASRLNRLSVGADVVSMRESGSERVKAYDDAKACSGLRGLPTPWTGVNNRIQGWVNGDLHVIGAMSNTGKTWSLCICADHSFNSGVKVLYVTLEMAWQRIARRLDAIHYKIPWSKMRNSDLDSTEEADWKAKVDADKTGAGDIVFADKRVVRTVNDVATLVQEHKPAIVYVDGGYRFEVSGGGGMGKWENTVAIINDLQIAAEQTNIPWVVTTQLGDANETDKKRSAQKQMRGWNVRYGKEWYINPDVFIGLYQDDELRAMKLMELHYLKIRDADETLNPLDNTTTIKWDLSEMAFDETAAVSGAEDGDDTIAVGDNDASKSGIVATGLL